MPPRWPCQVWQAALLVNRVTGFAAIRLHEQPDAVGNPQHNGPHRKQRGRAARARRFIHSAQAIHHTRGKFIHFMLHPVANGPFRWAPEHKAMAVAMGAKQIIHHQTRHRAGAMMMRWWFCVSVIIVIIIALSTGGKGPELPVLFHSLAMTYPRHKEDAECVFVYVCVGVKVHSFNFFPTSCPIFRLVTCTRT